MVGRVAPQDSDDTSGRRVDVLPGCSVERLSAADAARARVLFTLMADVFDVTAGVLSNEYLSDLLAHDTFWALAASIDGRLVGGLTAHTLPMTHAETREVFVYDVAVIPAYQRRGVGRQLVAALRALAMERGIRVVFVPADNDDGHALEFYRAIGGAAAAVTIFTFADRADGLVSE